MTRPGHDGTPPPGHDFGEFLRHALHAAADQVEPRPDGLERIRARVRSGPAYASKHSGATAAAGRFPGRHGPALERQARRFASARFAAHGAGRGHARRQPRDWRDGLLRSALASACVVFAIGVALAVPPLRQAFVQLSSAVGIHLPQQQPESQGGAGSGNPMGSSAGGAQSEQHLQQPGQRDGDRVPVEFFAVPRE